MLGVSCLVFPCAELTRKAWNIINSKKISIHTRIPNKRGNTKNLHKQNIQIIINHCYKHQIPLPINITQNKKQMERNAIPRRNLLTHKHWIERLKREMKLTETALIRSDKTPQLCLLHQNTIRKMTQRHLQDPQVYRKITEMENENINVAMKKYISRTKHRIPAKTQERQFKIQTKMQKPPDKWYNYPNEPKTRPIVTDTGSITSIMAKETLRKIQHIETASDTICNSSLQVCEEIDRINTRYTDEGELTVITADVENMYTNISVDKINNILGEEQYRIDEKTKTLENIQTITTNTNFEHRKEHYLQIKGLAMGSPISGALANIYMAHYENKILERHRTNILLYKRYIDDIIIITNKMETARGMINELEVETGLKINIEISKQRLIYLDMNIIINARGDNNTHKLIIYTPTFKYCAPVLRNHMGGKKEIKIIIGQILRIWRISNEHITITQTITRIMEMIRRFGGNNDMIKGIEEGILRRIRMNDGKYTHEHKLCHQCRETHTKKGTDVRKIMKYNTRIIASRTPVSCDDPDITSIITRRDSNGTERHEITPPTSIHRMTEKMTNLPNTITPIGQLNNIKRNLLMRKLGITVATNGTDRDETHPPYVHDIFINSMEVYGTRVANKAKSKIENFM
jgi:hypothetical protein